MDAEKQKRVWAAGAYAGLSRPTLASKLGVSVDTLKRRVAGEPRALESEEGLLQQIANATSLPVEFFTIDFGLLAAVPANPDAPELNPHELTATVERWMEQMNGRLARIEAALVPTERDAAADASRALGEALDEEFDQGDAPSSASDEDAEEGQKQ